MCFDTVLLNAQCHDADKESNRLLAHLLLLQRFISLLDEDSTVFHVCRKAEECRSSEEVLSHKTQVGKTWSHYLPKFAQDLSL